jgi:DNA mismatch repair protein MutS
MMTQYRELKRRFPDHLLLFRLGDFYELFLEDAELGARLLSITLTSRQGAPMAGIPHHAADGYIARLVQAGQKVAICEQMEGAGKGKKLLRRDVVRVITPGTLTDTAYLAGGANNFLMAIGRLGAGTGVALLDVSTGEFWVGEDGPGEGTVLAAALLRRPAEILLPETARGAGDLLARLQDSGAALTFADPSIWSTKRGPANLCAHFGVTTLEVFGVADMTAGLAAAAAALDYVRATQGDRLGHLARLQRLRPDDCMTLDETAVRTLEILEASDGSTRNALFGVLDETVTPMGARLLRQWLLQPLLDRPAIAARQDAIATLVEAPQARATLRRLLKPVGDLARLTSRATLGVAHARDLVGLRACLEPLPAIREATVASTPVLAEARAALAELDDVRAMLQAALVDEPPAARLDGGIIRESWNDGLRAIVSDAAEARQWIAGLEERERARTGLSSLRVRFNRVFGYGIEITHAQAARAPAEYVRRQTLTGAERYVTPELKEYEARVLGAEERRRRLEYELFDDLRGRVAARAAELLATARALATLDVVAALAEIAHARGHVRPVIEDGEGVLEIVEGRHPVLEARSGLPVTPNDLALDDNARVVILTGPNMAGKSVYLRQTGHIVVLAQMGAFVPARSARLGLVDRVFTRVGAQDNLARGQSTFLVEMVETAAILNNLTPRSLVLLDEVGRGTSTFDGLAIAWAVVEELHDRASRPKVLFATHFHELTQLAGRLSGVRNFHVAVREWNDEIVFLHKVQPGGTDRSYGIQVARLAGLPTGVVTRAKALLARFEEQGQATTDAGDAVQLGLFAPAADPMAVELAGLDLAHLTPIEALNLLVKWQQAAAGAARPARSAGGPRREPGTP